jgi:hypothetical protein
MSVIRCYINVNKCQTYVPLNYIARLAILTCAEDSRILGGFAIPTAKAVKLTKKEINQKQSNDDKVVIYVTTRSHYWLLVLVNSIFYTTVFA